MHLVGFHYKEYQDGRSAKHKIPKYLSICWVDHQVNVGWKEGEVGSGAFIGWGG
jgi:hypothetical protein